MRDHPQSCAEIRANLPLYVGGDLDASVLSSVSERMMEHLKGCDACGEALEAAEAARAALVDVRTPDAPDLWPGVRARMQSEGLLHSENEAGVEEPRVLRPVPVTSAMQTADGDRSGQGAPAAGSRFRTFWAGLGTVAAAAAIVGVVWLGGSSSTATPQNNPIGNDGAGSSSSVASADLGTESSGATSSARPDAQPEAPVTVEDSSMLADAGKGVQVGTPQVERSAPRTPSLRPVLPLSTPTVQLAGFDPSANMTPRGNRWPTPAEARVEPRDPADPQPMGLQRIEDGRSRLVPRPDPKTQRRGVLFLIEQVPMGAAQPQGQPAGQSPQGHGHRHHPGIR